MSLVSREKKSGRLVRKDENSALRQLQEQTFRKDIPCVQVQEFPYWNCGRSHRHLSLDSGAWR